MSIFISISLQFVNAKEYTSKVGETIQFKASDFSPETADSYKWDFGDEFTSSDQNPIHGYSSTGTKIVTLTMTTIITNPYSSQQLIIPFTYYATVTVEESPLRVPGYNPEIILTGILMSIGIARVLRTRRLF